MTMIDPKDKPAPGDGGFTNPRVFDTIEEAIAAGTSEDEYLGSPDVEGDDDEQD